MKELPVLTNTSPNFKEFKKKPNKILENLGAPHVESFNYMIAEGLDDCIRNIKPIEFLLPNEDRVKLELVSCSIAKPTVPPSTIHVNDRKIYPAECRQRHDTYKGLVTATMRWELNGVGRPEITKDIGEIPIMMKSSLCNLENMNAEQLVDRGEHENEWGGYFVVKGQEKLIRMLLQTRRNFPISLKRNSWKDRGHNFSNVGILIRCVKTDQTSTNNVLHYLTNGQAKLMLSHRKRLFYIPAMMIIKALTAETDVEIYKKLIAGFENDQYYVNCVQNMLRDMHEEGIHTQYDAKNFLGNTFRPNFYELPSWKTNLEIADYLIDETLMIHLNEPMDKFNLMVFMMQKLFNTAQDKCKSEGVDCVMMQEILLGGHLYQKYLKEKLEGWLNGIKYNIIKKYDSTTVLDQPDVLACVRNAGNIEKKFENFLATGNINSPTGLGLMQTTGLVIIAENINRMRYMSHFRSVHRGSFFVEMRTTEARQLLPDAWGFICPVHTPDGSPCGLLNHLTVDCVVSNSPDAKLVENISKILTQCGMIPVNAPNSIKFERGCVVMLEGKVIGHIKETEASRIVDKLRLLKIKGKQIPKMLEIVMVPNKKGGQFPGLYLFVSAARMMRPVLNLQAKKIEYIGTFEQIYMDICITADEAYPDVTTHMELSKTSFLSNLAKLIPMPDCNQSPRNMYQCQMGKQTMGTPYHNWRQQSHAKFFRLQTPATPLFRPVHHDNIELDDFAMGTNAIVAVISYTGYDMEDAMIINKSAYERGFAHGCIYKSEFIELEGDSFFVRNPNQDNLSDFMDNDGLPHPGMRYSLGDPYYCYFDTNKHVYVLKKYKNSEDGMVDNIRFCGSLGISEKKSICLTVRITRNPTVGDKFASRAGQKGICSQKWPAVDLPFTESGLIPDIIFNPHGFPSRMTIAMMIETMAGKTASCHGLVHDATPFRFTEENTAIDYFGRLLETSGYNYYGTERMYSGVDGRELSADIFFGVVHYQRLRHMVSDKWQVRSTGPIDLLTHQPNKGRSKGGGVRFGEMERDALIAHGASFLLQDRLFHCSDRISALICRKCGTLLGPIVSISKRNVNDLTEITNIPATCRLCKDENEIGYIEIPYIFKYLVAQLSAVNINVKLNFASPID